MCNTYIIKSKISMDTLSVLFIGDVHFQIGNLEVCRLFSEKMVHLASLKQPDLIIVGGDILHTHERVHILPLNLAYSFIQKLSEISMTYVLVGNHDYISNQEFLSENHWMNGMKTWKNVVIVDTVHIIDVEGVKLVMTPYIPVGRFVEALDTAGDKWREADCIFAHQEFYGCKMGAIVSEIGDKWDGEYPHVVSGHIHSKQRPQENIYYSGSAIQHAFGESEDNTVALLTFFKDGNSRQRHKYGLEELNLDMPIKKILYADIDKLDSFDYEKHTAVRADGLRNSIKLTLYGDDVEFRAIKKTRQYKNIIAAGIKVVFKKDTVEPVNSCLCETSIVYKDPSTRFRDILFESVEANNKTMNNPYLYQVYEEIVNNRQIQPLLS